MYGFPIPAPQPLSLTFHSLILLLTHHYYIFPLHSSPTATLHSSLTAALHQSLVGATTSRHFFNIHQHHFAPTVVTQITQPTPFRSYYHAQDRRNQQRGHRPISTPKLRKPALPRHVHQRPLHQRHVHQRRPLPSTRLATAVPNCRRTQLSSSP